MNPFAIDVHSSILLVLAVAVIGGLISSGLTKRLKGPQVLGYILAGIGLGKYGINVISMETVNSLEPLSFLALGVIGFLVGGELEFQQLKKYARQFATILLFEGLLATILVGGGTFVVVYWAIGSIPLALVVAIVLGAIASATDPASTMGVIWEYRAAGVLTTTLVAVVALDDVLAMALYGIASNVAQRLAKEPLPIAESLLHFATDIGGALVIGITVGAGIVFFLRKRGNSDSNLFALVGAVLLSVGIAQSTGTDLILASMTSGIVAVNMAPQHIKHLLGQVRQISIPIYILFFVLVGARLSFAGMPGWIWMVVAVYVVGRTMGKIWGAWIGARISGTDKTVARYVGVGLFSQGGVAIGLAMVASSHLTGISLTPELSLGEAIVSVVTTTTFLIQLTGPTAVKWALSRANETHRRLTAQDILSDYTVTDVLATSFSCQRHMSLEHVLDEFANHPELESFSVTTNQGRFLGEVRMVNLRPVLAQRHMWSLVVVEDLINRRAETVTCATALKDASQLMKNLGTEQLSVVDDGLFKGYLLKTHIRQLIKNKSLQGV